MNYEKLYRDKELLDNRITLVIDNDGGYWTHEDQEQISLCEEYEERYGTPNGYRDVVDILNASGIKSEWC